MRYDTYHFARRFRGAMLPPAYNSANPALEFVQKITKTSGSPAVTNTGKGLKLALDSTSEAQVVQVYMLDQLPFSISEVAYAAIDAYVPSGEQLSLSPVKAFFGLGSAINAAYASMTALAGFSVTGASTQGNVYAESDDNVHDLAADTTIAMPTAMRRFWIDMYTGTVPGYGATAARGGQGSLKFFHSDAGAAPNLGNRKQVCKTTDFDMSSYSSDLQFVAQIEKASGAGVGSLVIGGFYLWTRDQLG